MRPWFIAGILFALSSLSNTSVAADPAQEYIQAVGAITGFIDSSEIYVSICKSQFPDMATRLDRAYKPWREKYSTLYAELERRRLAGFKEESRNDRSHLDLLVTSYEKNKEKGRDSIRKAVAADLVSARRGCEGVLMTFVGPSGNIEKQFEKELRFMRTVPEGTP